MRFKLMLIISGLLLCTAGTASATSWIWTDGNDHLHTYTMVRGSFTWDQAHDSLPDGAYLATITTESEQSALVRALSGIIGEFWLGGRQNSGPGIAPDENWAWQDTGETFSWTNWQPGEPNDWGRHDEIHLAAWSRFDWRWNDEHSRSNIMGYIVETGMAYDPVISLASRSPIPNPEPAPMMLFGMGLLFLARMGRRTK